jgi:hypothetical protein
VEDFLGGGVPAPQAGCPDNDMDEASSSQSLEHAGRGIL